MTGRRPIRAGRIFVDTSAYFALANENEAFHAAASSIMSRLAESRARFFSTNFIVAETHALVLRTLGRCVAA